MLTVMFVVMHMLVGLSLFKIGYNYGCLKMCRVRLNALGDIRAELDKLIEETSKKEGVRWALRN